MKQKDKDKIVAEVIAVKSRMSYKEFIDTFKNIDCYLTFFEDDGATISVSEWGRLLEAYGVSLDTKMTDCHLNIYFN